MLCLLLSSCVYFDLPEYSFYMCIRLEICRVFLLSLYNDGYTKTIFGIILLNAGKFLIWNWLECYLE